MKKRVFLVNKEKDLSLFVRAVANGLLNKDEDNGNPFNYKFVQLEINQDLLDHLCQIVAESFQEAQSLGCVPNHREVKEGSYRSLISSLVFYKWNLEKVGLLDMWIDLVCRLTRRQLFTNGNKRTALLTIRNFIYACGFRLLSKGFPSSWERLLIEMATAENEETAQELIKEKIVHEIVL